MAELSAQHKAIKADISKVAAAEIAAYGAAQFAMATLLKRFKGDFGSAMAAPEFDSIRGALIAADAALHSKVDPLLAARGVPFDPTNPGAPGTQIYEQIQQEGAAQAASRAASDGRRTQIIPSGDTYTASLANIVAAEEPYKGRA